MESCRELSGNTSCYYNVKAVARRKSSVVIFYTQFTIAAYSSYLIFPAGPKCYSQARENDRGLPGMKSQAST